MYLAHRFEGAEPVPGDASCDQEPEAGCIRPTSKHCSWAAESEQRDPAKRSLSRAQLGYKMAKYIMEIEAVNSFGNIGRGKGGFWEDRGYEWYAGI